MNTYIELLQILACPQCKGDLQLSEHEDSFECHTCMLLFHIRDGIPVMLLDKASKMQ